MINVLFVCLGNICRSPMAEGIFKNFIENRNLASKISCDSAGTASYHIGKSPDPRTLSVLEKNNIYTSQKARQLVIRDFETFDYILVMDKENLHNTRVLENKTNNSIANVSLALQYSQDDTIEEVPDPYYGGKEGFNYVYNLLDNSLSNFIELLTEKHQLH